MPGSSHCCDCLAGCGDEERQEGGGKTEAAESEEVEIDAIFRVTGIRNI